MHGRTVTIVKLFQRAWDLTSPTGQLSETLGPSLAKTRGVPGPHAGAARRSRGERAGEPPSPIDDRDAAVVRRRPTRRGAAERARADRERRRGDSPRGAAEDGVDAGRHGPRPRKSRATRAARQN